MPATAVGFVTRLFSANSFRLASRENSLFKNRHDGNVLEDRTRFRSALNY